MNLMTPHFEAGHLIDLFSLRNPSISVSIQFVDTLPKGEVYRIDRNAGSYEVAIPKTTRLGDYMDVLGSALSELEAHATGKPLVQCAEEISTLLASRGQRFRKSLN